MLILFVFAWLADVRLEKARAELMNKNKSMSEIAFDLGFSSPQHFSFAFKKKYGVPPGRITGEDSYFDLPIE